MITNASGRPTALSEVDLSTSLSAAAGYTASCGFRVIPIASRAKKCTLKKWQELRFDVPDLAAHFNGHPQNIGVLLGGPSGGLMDVDVDCPEAAIIAPTYLPATDAVFGRAGKPASHWLYRVSDGAKTVQFEDKKGEMLIELRGDGAQTVFPPSVHQSGEPIRFEKAGVPATVAYDDLRRRVSLIAAGSLLSRHWPSTGSRHNAAMALAGGLLRAGWSIEDAEKFIRAVAGAADDDEVEDRVRCVTSTQEKLELGEPARGWPYLAEIIEKKVIDKVRKWLRISISVSAGRDDIPYLSTPTGLVYMKFTPEGEVPVMLTNFNARIVSDVQEDDGVETKRTFGIEAALAGRQPVRFAVPADEFAGLNWITHFLGAKAIVRPGQSIAGHTRVAIQELSEDIDERLVYGHSGWRVIDGHHVYLHCGGGISADGLIDDVEVALAGSLNGYVLPAPPSGSELTTAVQASLKLLDLGPAALMYVLLATVFRAAVGGTDYSIWIFGRTGTFKSELATLLQRHFGAFTARSLPGSWSSTANALEDQGFRAKDTIFVIDDFKPSGSGDDKLHQQADRLLRAAGNGSARQRMKPDTSLRPSRPPRCQYVCTGEDLPRGQSLRGRLIITEMRPGDVPSDKLTAAQKLGDQGLYAQCLSGFIRWVAPRLDQIRRSIAGNVDGLRTMFAAEVGPCHPRLCPALADLYMGFQLATQFAVEATGEEALTKAEAAAENEKCRLALIECGKQQQPHQGSADPAQRFIALLSSALASGKAHLANPKGKAPSDPAAWGWRSVKAGALEDWHPAGERVGWIEDSDLFIEVTAGLRVANAQVGDGERLSISERMLGKQLHEAKFLASNDLKENSYTVRGTFEGRRRRVLHMRAADFGHDGARADEEQIVGGEDEEVVDLPV